MPQITKGGKFIFGWSKIQENGAVHLPKMAVEEYDITKEGKVYLISGSKQTGGFVVTKKGLLYDSKIGNILKDNEQLCSYKIASGEFIKYKGRLYTWCDITQEGIIYLTEDMREVLNINIGDKLLSIRSSDIAFCMGAKGQLIERAENYPGEIEFY